MPRILGPRNPAESEYGHVHPYNEERAPGSSIASTEASVESLVSKVSKFFSPARDIHPTGAQKDFGALPKGPKNPMSYLQSLVGRYPLGVETHTSGAAVEDPEFSFKDTMDSVATLVRNRDVDGTNDMAHSLLRAIAVRNDDAGRLMRDACRDAGVSPEEFFHLLPISEDLLERGFKEPARYHEIFSNLVQWLTYVRFTNKRRYQEALEITKAEGSPLVVNHFFPEQFFVDTLVEKGKPENVMAFLNYLLGIEESKKFAGKALLLLQAKDPDVTLKMLPG
ncbi:unnamed protein product [Hyaloperonospora brassicae]|uniref:RxLR effector candidate protein n=1 Tax=Hyaloperonospora brassicae TaxID=162125 RepID=A0AAV0UX02_HYABA|nr:unnamed protein product [Hyaloperonospora brassicae]